jgi:hypothetical protein
MKTMMMENKSIVDRRYPGCYAELDDLDMWTVYSAEGNEIMSDRELEFAWACSRWYVDHEHDWKRIEVGNVDHVRRRNLAVSYILGSAILVITLTLYLYFKS